MQRPQVPKTEQPATRDEGTRIDRQMQAQKSSVRGNSLTEAEGGALKKSEKMVTVGYLKRWRSGKTPRGSGWWPILRESTEKQLTIATLNRHQHSLQGSAHHLHCFFLIC